MAYKTPGGEIYSTYSDMLKQPHLMIAGATGSGKSVIVNAIIHTALHYLPTDVPNGKQFILIDPKRVELVDYKEVPHTLLYASEPEDILKALNHAMDLTEERYRTMQAIHSKKHSGSDVYVIIDEFADLMTTQGRKVKPLIQRLAQIGRAAKVHIILCTQTPISKVIPTEIKCNFDARVGLRTRSRQDSRNILDLKEPDLSTFPRYGTGYYITPEQRNIYRMPMIPDADRIKLIDYWIAQKPVKRKPFRPLINFA